MIHFLARLPLSLALPRRVHLISTHIYSVVSYAIDANVSLVILDLMERAFQLRMLHLPLKSLAVAYNIYHLFFSFFMDLLSYMFLVVTTLTMVAYLIISILYFILPKTLVAKLRSGCEPAN